MALGNSQPSPLELHYLKSCMPSSQTTLSPYVQFYGGSFNADKLLTIIPFPQPLFARWFRYFDFGTMMEHRRQHECQHYINITSTSHQHHINTTPTSTSALLSALPLPSLLVAGIRGLLLLNVLPPRGEGKLRARYRSWVCMLPSTPSPMSLMT